MSERAKPEFPNLQPRLKARLIVQQHVHMLYGEHLDADKDIYVVWFCKTLQNWKALLSTTLIDDHYYEVTYDGDKKVMYLDDYKKLQNVMFPDFDIVEED